MSAPFEITRWDSPKPPDEALLTRQLDREKLTITRQELACDFRSPEMKFTVPMVRVLVAGHVQISFPGYGVAELHAGDWLEITADILHDIRCLGSEAAVLLSAERT